ncbi:hypothetical protein PISL3812_00108 [Talaromyces islandicus]|uniref:Zn(2)-C6 fungal-type domain-containing protein n=1 Tax=Talaromyces islandicus TaxID=28573 RepID=A0A0U1LIZ2_TALIS|nr:hypothetical protein PISL3812_00108 [Talaromyces islandicus]
MTMDKFADRRLRKACDRCHSQKLGCQRQDSEKCVRCTKANKQCTWSMSLRSRRDWDNTSDPVVDIASRNEGNGQGADEQQMQEDTAVVGGNGSLNFAPVEEDFPDSHLFTDILTATPSLESLPELGHVYSSSRDSMATTVSSNHAAQRQHRIQSAGSPIQDMLGHNPHPSHHQNLIPSQFGTWTPEEEEGDPFRQARDAMSSNKRPRYGDWDSSSSNYDTNITSSFLQPIEYSRTNARFRSRAMPVPVLANGITSTAATLSTIPPGPTTDKPDWLIQIFEINGELYQQARVAPQFIREAKENSLSALAAGGGVGGAFDQVIRLSMRLVDILQELNQGLDNNNKKKKHGMNNDGDDDDDDDNNGNGFNSHTNASVENYLPAGDTATANTTYGLDSGSVLIILSCYIRIIELFSKLLLGIKYLMHKSEKNSNTLLDRRLLHPIKHHLPTLTLGSTSVDLYPHMRVAILLELVEQILQTVSSLLDPLVRGRGGQQQQQQAGGVFGNTLQEFYDLEKTLLGVVSEIRALLGKKKEK